MRTRDKLAAELRAVAAKASVDNAIKYHAFARRAETGEFDDYASTYVCPITQLHGELMAAGFTKFAARVASGEFDATKEESDEWARSPEAQEMFSHLSPGIRKLFGDPEGMTDVERFRALLIPATRTVYKTADVRAKSLARATIAKELPALLEEVEQLRAANRIQAKATELWMARAHHAEHRLATELGEPDDDC